MSIVIYCMFKDVPCAKPFDDADFAKALAYCQELREDGFTHVSMSSEPGNMVGKLGVSSVENGLCPDGIEYDWSKKQRGDGPQKVIT